MFAKKINQLQMDKVQYFIEEQEYHYLIEILLFKEQKKTFGKIEYNSNGVNIIEINILKSENVQSIRLPWFDSNLKIWKSKLYTIEEIEQNPKSLIDKYSIKIAFVNKLNNSIDNSEIDRLKTELEHITNENNRLKSELEQITNENNRLKTELEQITDENNKLKFEQKNTPQLNTFEVEKLILTNDIILNNAPISFQVNEQLNLTYTLNDLIVNDFELWFKNNYIKLNSLICDDSILRYNKEQKAFIYTLEYDRQYTNAVVSFPFDQNITFKLINNQTYLIKQQTSYSVYIHIILV